MDWEVWLRKAAQRPTDNEDSKRQTTEDQIRRALKQYAPLNGKPFIVYAKGSYANNTNVRLNYDIDIAVEYTGFFFSDMCFELAGEPDSTVGVVPAKDTYTTAEFKTDVLAALTLAFGGEAVQPGNIAYRIRNGKTTLPADVVPCWEYRRYDRVVRGYPVFHVGSRVFPMSGGFKNNFPKIQLDDGTAKNLRTGKRYKRMVRALKKLQTRMISDGVLDQELPSYLTECLVFNVPDGPLTDLSYLSNTRSVLMCIFNATLNSGDWYDWEHVHGLEYLFRSGEFDRVEVHKMADAAWDHLGFE